MPITAYRIPFSTDDLTQDQALQLVCDMPSVREVLRVDPPRASHDDPSFVVLATSYDELAYDAATAFNDDPDDESRITGVLV